MRIVIKIALGALCLGCLVFIFCTSFVLADMVMSYRAGLRISHRYRASSDAMTIIWMITVLSSAILVSVFSLVSFMRQFDKAKWSNGHLGFFVLVILTLAINKGCGVIF